jgi:hypothetical protein
MRPVMFVDQLGLKMMQIMKVLVNVWMVYSVNLSQSYVLHVIFLVKLVLDMKQLIVQAVKRITNLVVLHQTPVYVKRDYIQKEVSTIVDHVQNHVQPVHLIV